jgi:hypothetical protein
MPEATANAFPRKHFFLEMFTRDISLEDCVLDLVDNSIDALVRSNEFDPAKEILEVNGAKTRKAASDLPKIDLTLSTKEVIIDDDCGGIPPDIVENELFTFGHHPDASLHQQLGVYGVGLKRAIFKIAEKFEMESRNTQGSFTAEMDVDEWSQRDETLDDWKIPITFDKPVKKDKAGTTIRFSPIREEVKMRLRDGTFEGRLTRAIAQTYSLFLERNVRVKLNDKVVEPEPIPLGSSKETKPGQADFTKGNVKVRIFCGLAARQPLWTHERAGWYVLCNGRVVVSANKDDLTGWGLGLPTFHSKYKGFVGVAIFRSHDPLALPWTTTKRGLNQESPIFQDVKREMVLLARPIISFLNNMYPSDYEAEEPEEREIAGKVVQADLRQLAHERPKPFVVERRSTVARTTVRICFDAKKSDVERVKRAVGQPRWGANQVGKHTFDHFLKTECPE